MRRPSGTNADGGEGMRDSSGGLNGASLGPWAAMLGLRWGRTMGDLFVLFILAAGSAICAIAPTHAPVEPLFAVADIVAVARCSSVAPKDPSQPAEQNGRLVPLDYVVRYSVIKVYKGVDPTATLSILIRPPDPASGQPDCRTGNVLLFVLSAGPGGMFTLADANFGIRDFPGVEPGGAAGQSGLDQLQADCTRAAASGVSAQERPALQLLCDFQHVSQATVEALSRLPVPPDHGAAVLILDILARANPGQYLKDLVRAIQESQSMDALTMILACDLLENKANVQDLAALEQLVDKLPAHSPFVSEMVVDNPFRVAAMRGIRSLKAAGSVPFLVQHLDDPGLRVSHLAVLALAEITHKGHEFATGMGPFKRRPQRYRDLWHRWWETEGSREFPRDDDARPPK